MNPVMVLGGRVYFECGDYLNNCDQGEEYRILFSSLYLSPLLSVCSKEKESKKQKKKD